MWYCKIFVIRFQQFSNVIFAFKHWQFILSSNLIQLFGPIQILIRCDSTIDVNVYGKFNSIQWLILVCLFWSVQLINRFLMYYWIFMNVNFLSFAYWERSKQKMSEIWTFRFQCFKTCPFFRCCLKLRHFIWISDIQF